MPHFRLFDFDQRLIASSDPELRCNIDWEVFTMTPNRPGLNPAPPNGVASELAKALACDLLIAIVVDHLLGEEVRQLATAR